MTLDGIEKQGDALPAGGQPSTGEQDPSAPQVFTMEQVNERHGKLDSQIAALTKERDTFKTSHEALSAKVTELLRRQEEAEDEALMADPVALDDLRKSRIKKANAEAKAQELAEQEAELNRSKAEHEAELAELRILKRTELAAEVAVAKKVSIDGILKGIALAKDESREAMEAIAELLPPANPREPKVLDSGRNYGGGEDLRNLSPGEKIKYALANPGKTMR